MHTFIMIHIKQPERTFTYAYKPMDPLQMQYAKKAALATLEMTVT